MNINSHITSVIQSWPLCDNFADPISKRKISPKVPINFVKTKLPQFQLNSDKKNINKINAPLFSTENRWRTHCSRSSRTNPSRVSISFFSILTQQSTTHSLIHYMIEINFECNTTIAIICKFLLLIRHGIVSGAFFVYGLCFANKNLNVLLYVLDDLIVWLWLWQIFSNCMDKINLSGS